MRSVSEELALLFYLSEESWKRYTRPPDGNGHVPGFCAGMAICVSSVRGMARGEKLHMFIMSTLVNTSRSWLSSIGTLSACARRATIGCTIGTRMNCRRKERSCVSGLTEGEPEYKEGFPNIPGWYDVLVDGVEERLVFRFCGTCGKFVWEDISGNRPRVLS